MLTDEGLTVEFLPHNQRRTMIRTMRLPPLLALARPPGPSLTSNPEPLTNTYLLKTERLAARAVVVRLTLGPDQECEIHFC